MKKQTTVLSVKMSKEEAEILSKAAKSHQETKSGYARRVLLESAQTPLSSNKDVMEILMEISYELQRMTQENYSEVMKEINCKGERICRVLSSR